MKKLEIIVNVFLGCLAIAGVLAGMFLIPLFLSETLLKVLELTGAQRIPEIGELFRDLFGIWVGLGTVMLLSFAIAHRFGPNIEAYGETFQSYFFAFFSLLLLSWFAVIFLEVGGINSKDLINNFVKNIPSQPPRFEFEKYYREIFRGWPFWLGSGLLFSLLAWSFFFPSSFASLFGERRQDFRLD